MNLDDPKLTAYALGELSVEERRAVEEALRNDPEAQAFVEETALFGELLSREFHAELPGASLAPAQRAEVLDQARGDGKIVRFLHHPVLVWGLSLAAALAVLAGFAGLHAPGLQKNAPLAQTVVSPKVIVDAESIRVAPSDELPLQITGGSTLARNEASDYSARREDSLVALAKAPEPSNTPQPLRQVQESLSNDSGQINLTANKSQDVVSRLVQTPDSNAQLNLTARNTYTGTTTVVGGVLSVPGNAAEAGGVKLDKVASLHPVLTKSKMQITDQLANADGTAANREAPLPETILGRDSEAKLAIGYAKQKRELHEKQLASKDADQPAAPAAPATLKQEPQFVTITPAQSKSSGRLVWSPELTLKSAMAASGGLSWSELGEIIIVRGEKKIIAHPALISKGAEPDPKLQPGDLIQLP